MRQEGQEPFIEIERNDGPAYVRIAAIDFISKNEHGFARIHIGQIWFDSLQKYKEVIKWLGHVDLDEHKRQMDESLKDLDEGYPS